MNKFTRLIVGSAFMVLATSALLSGDAQAATIPGMEGVTPPAGTTATSPSSYGAPSGAIDGNLNTMWNAPAYSGTLDLNFPNPQMVSAVQIAVNATPATYETYTIYGKQNGVWIQICPATRHYVPTNRPYILPAFSVTPGQYSAIRFAINSGSSWPGINEVTLTLGETADQSAPQTTLNVTGTTSGNGIYSSSLNVKLSATDDSSGVDKTEYRVNGGDWLSYSNPFDLTEEGTYTVEYHSTDKAGNVEPAHTETYTIDKTAPMTTAYVAGTSGETGYYSSNISVQLNAADNLSGVARTEYRINGGGWTNYLGAFSINAEGTFQVEYRSVDVAGNVESTHLETYVIDTTTPQTTLDIQGTPGGSSGWFTTDVILAIPCHDPNLQSTQYRINGGDWITYTSPITLTDGQYTVEYRSTDKAGNVEAVQTTQINVDTIAPVASVQLPAPDASGWYTDDVEVKITGADNLSGVATIEYMIDNGTTAGQWTTYTGSLVLRQNCGCKIHYRTTDEAGNQSPPGEIEVKIDKTPPNLNIRVDNATLWPPNHKMVPIRVTIDASDVDSGLASVVLTSITSNEPDEGTGDGDTAGDIQNAEFGTNDTAFDLRAERSGKGTGRVYTITYTATDRAGNVTTATATVTVPHSQKK